MPKRRGAEAGIADEFVLFRQQFRDERESERPADQAAVLLPTFHLHRGLRDQLDSGPQVNRCPRKGFDMADEVSPKAGRTVEAGKRERLGRGRMVVARRNASKSGEERDKVALRAPEEEKNKVVQIVQRLQEGDAESRTRKRFPWVPVSLAACVALPTFIGALFFLFVASDRYVSTAAFAIRTSEEQTVDLLGGLTGLPSTKNVSDSYIVADYIVSRDMVEELERRLPLRSFYLEGDFLSRLSVDASLDTLVDYWDGMAEVYYDSTKNTLVVEVQAFKPEDADRIVREIIEVVRNLVNELSAQARRDAVQFAASEVARAEVRIRSARDAMFKFRIEHNEVDPSATAQATLGLAAQLEAERSKLSSELASLSGYLADDAPSVQMLRSRIAALASEISRIQGQVSARQETGTVDASTATPAADASPNPQSNALASVLATYQELVLDQEFAERAYTAAMASLETARSEVNRNQSYLAIYGQPRVAEDAAYPRRALNILIILVLSGILWAIGGLGVLTVRDHIQ